MVTNKRLLSICKITTVKTTFTVGHRHNFLVSKKVMRSADTKRIDAQKKSAMSLTFSLFNGIYTHFVAYARVSQTNFVVELWR